MAKTPSAGAGAPRWPTLDEQLAESRVIHGSALERLIRDNQDFSMLRPEEADDKLPLPPWLRVYWRKQHPDAVYAGPSGGYPLVLHDYYRWMLDHQDLPVQEDAPPATRQSQGKSHGQ
jgi:hypothetical protein